MKAEESPDVPVPERLQVLGVTLVTEWDTLAFLFQHKTSISTAAQIARLVGYDKAEIGAALQTLDGLRLIRRSRTSQGARIYEFCQPQEPGRHTCLVELMNLAQHRAGRLLLLKHLQRRRPGVRRGGDRGLRLA